MPADRDAVVTTPQAQFWGRANGGVGMGLQPSRAHVPSKIGGLTLSRIAINTISDEDCVLLSHTRMDPQGGGSRRLLTRFSL